MADLLMFLFMAVTLLFVFLSRHSKSKWMHRCTFCLWLAWGASLVYAAISLTH